ncbi:hypothetical protein NON00_16430 [Roseomonas sp. GC11]|uniref:hypothetical protein n=1 Tax=Roseomonas sp. GC11 TaxID=2950546 RepID=UPI00210B2E98|nr:hypothetical protein [Roseomonas sp. GC11]MCQ4161507.1 hypothetical protein [Roseomonas sp. GC11]
MPRPAPRRTLPRLLAPGEGEPRLILREIGRLTPGACGEARPCLRGTIGGRAVVVLPLARPDRNGATHRAMEACPAAPTATAPAKDL